MERPSLRSQITVANLATVWFSPICSKDLPRHPPDAQIDEPVCFFPPPPRPARRRSPAPRLHSKRRPKTTALLKETSVRPIDPSSNLWSTRATRTNSKQPQIQPHRSDALLLTTGIKPTTGMQPRHLNLLCIIRAVHPSLLQAATPPESSRRSSRASKTTLKGTVAKREKEKREVGDGLIDPTAKLEGGSSLSEPVSQTVYVSCTSFRLLRLFRIPVAKALYGHGRRRR